MAATYLNWELESVNVDSWRHRSTLLQVNTDGDPMSIKFTCPDWIVMGMSANGIAHANSSPNFGETRTGTIVAKLSGLTATITITQDTSPEVVRNILVVYCQHPAQLQQPDPLAPGYDAEDPDTWVYNDTATNVYNEAMKKVGWSVEEWESAGCPSIYGSALYNNADLPAAVYTNIPTGNRHKINFVHLGLNEAGTEITSPFIVNETWDYGCFVAKEPLSSSYPENPAGWENYTLGQSLHNSLKLEVISSGYLDTVVPEGMEIDRNRLGWIDQVIFNPPPCLNSNYYRPNQQYTPAEMQPAGGVTINEVTYTGLQTQMAGIALDSDRIFHEYYHTIYPVSQSYSQPLFEDRDFTEAHSTGKRAKIKVGGNLNEIYIYPASGQPAGDPWGFDPCAYASHVAFNIQVPGRQFIGVMHPLNAASLGMTDLNRWAKHSRTYYIGNCADTMDYLCLQSPTDKSQFLVLSTYYPKVLNNSTVYTMSGDKMKGVYATVIKFVAPENPNIEAYSYDLSSGLNVCTYMSATMTEMFGYQDLDASLKRTVVETEVEEDNEALVLLDHDHPDTNPSGLQMTNDPFGITVEWVGWSDVNGVKTAKVLISGLPDWDHWADELTSDTTIGITDAEVRWETSEPWDVADIELDTTDTFDSDDLVSETVTYPASSVSFCDLLPDTTYYYRVRFSIDDNVGTHYALGNFTTLLTAQTPSRRYAADFKAGSTSDNTRLVQPDDLVVLTLPDEASQDEKVRVCKAKDLLPSQITTTLDVATSNGHAEFYVIRGVIKSKI